jgi:hypothetical protein
LSLGEYLDVGAAHIDRKHIHTRRVAIFRARRDLDQ